MPLTIRWADDAHSIIHVRHELPFTLNDYTDMLEQAIVMMQESRDGVAWISDWTPCPTIPFDNETMARLHFLRTGDKVSLRILAGASEEVFSFAQMYLRMNPSLNAKVFFVQDYTKALALIKRQRRMSRSASAL
jgi:hypothetical protein